MAAPNASSDEIQDVSDTALWVAYYRAQESERPDALFHDRLAGVLLGERGRRLARRMPARKFMGWFMAVRTVAIDRLILRAIEQGARTVVNLGAGLDTRPYRMDRLPPSLRWIEVDFPHMIELKNRKLAGERPICGLERIAADLSDDRARRELLARIGAETHAPVLVISEGVIPYLTNEQADALARDLGRTPHFTYWIQDYYRMVGRRSITSSWRMRLKSAPIRFRAPDWLSFFADRGWKAQEVIGTGDEARRIRRMPPVPLPLRLFWVLLSAARREKLSKLTGYVLLKNTAAVCLAAWVFF